MYSSFNSNKSGAHQTSLVSDLKTDIVSEDLHASTSGVASDLYEECPGQSTEEVDDDQCETNNINNQLKMNVSSLFLKIQGIHPSPVMDSNVVYIYC